MSKRSRTLADTMEDTKDRHRRYMRSIQHPIRREILRAMERGASTMDDFVRELGEEPKVLDWHLKSLEHGFCIERVGERFTLTQEGRIVDYLDKKSRSNSGP